MTTAKVVIREKGSYSTTHEYDVINAKLSQNGRKKSDEFNAMLPINAIVNEGDDISYIHDIVDLDYCSSIWTFNFAAYDERGYNIDVSTSILSARFYNALAGKFYGYNAMEFASAFSWVRVNTSLSNRIDFTGQFDIYVWFYPKAAQTQTKPIVYSKFDGIRGIEIGFDTSGGAGNWRPLMRIGNGTTSTDISGTTTKITANEPNLIRVYRDELNVIHMEVMGIADDTNHTESASMHNAVQTNYLGGGNHAVNDVYEGWLFQIRTYSGSYLSEDDAFKILQSKPQAMIMKFGGKIWDKKDNTTYRFVQAQSYAQMLSDWTVSKDSITEVPFGGVSRGAVGSPTANEYAGAQGVDLIIADLMHNIDTDFRVGINNVTPISLSDPFVADGNLVDIINELSIASFFTFYTTPRKVIIFEFFVGIDTNIEFIQDPTVSTGYDIRGDNSNDLILSNDVTAVGTAGNIGYSQTIAAGDTIHSLKINVPQFTSVADLTLFADNLVFLNGEIKPRYIVNIGATIHHIRYNQNALIVNVGKNILESLPLASIETTYPQGKTIMHFGQYPLDFTEQMLKSGQTTRGLQSNTTV